MIKNVKKNVKNSKKFENSPKIGKFKFSSSFLHFFTYFLHFFTFFYHVACKDAKIHQKLEKSNFLEFFTEFSKFL